METLLSFQGFIVYFSASPSSSLVSRVVSLFHLQPFFLWGHQVFALPALQILGLYQLILCINLQSKNMAKLFVPPHTIHWRSMYPLASVRTRINRCQRVKSCLWLGKASSDAQENWGQKWHSWKRKVWNLRKKRQLQQNLITTIKVTTTTT